MADSEHIIQHMNSIVQIHVVIVQWNKYCIHFVCLIYFLDKPTMSWMNLIGRGLITTKGTRIKSDQNYNSNKFQL